MPTRKPWSFYAGKKATSTRPSSRVRVFEREGTPRIYLSRAWVRTGSGAVEARPLAPGTTRETAKLIAKRTALVREEAINEGGLHSEVPVAATLERLLNLYHDSTRSRKWSKGHRLDQNRMRAFWEATLGTSRRVEDLTPAMVERAAARAARSNGWTARTEEKYLKYLKAVTRWGWRKERLYPTDPLLGAETPDVSYDTSDRIYTTKEIRKLLEPNEKVDWRVTLAVNIAADTGRRIGAIRQLKTEHLAIVSVPGPDGEDHDRLFLHFTSAVEKTRRGSWAPVSRKTWELLTETLEREEVQAAGWLFPGGDARRKTYWGQPLESRPFVQLLRNAEEALKVPYVPRRGFHGIKRLHVTVGFEVSGGDASLVGDVTGNVSAELLRNTYRQQDRRRVTDQVDDVRAAIEGT